MTIQLANIVPTAINQFRYPHVIADTTDMPMLEWRQIRKNFLGGSDAAPVIGLSRYKSPIGVYFDKTEEAVSDFDSQKMRAGRMMEPIIAAMFAEDTGKHVVRQPFFYAHPEHSFMGANVDFGIYGENAGLECKNSAYRKDWEDGNVPDEYYLQCNHYMAVTGADRWYLAYLIDGWDFHYTTIERNEKLIETLIAQESDFWYTHILPRNPPAFDGSDSATELLKVMFPSETAGSEPAEIPSDFDCLWVEVDEITKQEKALENRKKEIKNQICAIIGDRSTGMSPNYIFTWNTQERKGFTVEPTSFRVLRGKKRKEVN